MDVKQTPGATQDQDPGAIVEIDHLRARFEVERKRQGLTLAQVAEKMDRSPGALTEVLRTGNPNLSTLHRLATALGLSTADLLRPVSVEEYGEAMLPRREEATTHNG